MTMTTHEQTSLRQDAQGFLNVWKFVHDRSGMSFAEDKLEFLRTRIARRMKDIGAVGYADYLKHLTFSRGDREFLRLMDDLTINETSFFREPAELDALTNRVIPELLANRAPDDPIRFWSAGCSTGEEPYSLAMLLHELTRSIGPFEYEIAATDISEDALTAAQRGQYAAAVVFGMERRYLEQYFVLRDERFEVTSRLKSRVQFQFGNLMDDQLPAKIGPVDVVLCRNVMIYFSQGVRRQVIERLYSTLKPGGYLIVGHNETLHGVSEQFEHVYVDGVLIYRRTES